MVYLFFQAQIGKLFGSQFPCRSVGAKYRSKKNNDHWTEDEMIELVIGVSKRGIGRWSRVKDDYFFNIGSYSRSSQGTVTSIIGSNMFPTWSIYMLR